MKLPADNLKYPVKIETGISTGSGFFIMHEQELYLVTAKHVVYQINQNPPRPYAGTSKIICHPQIATSLPSIPVPPRILELNLDTLTSEGNLKAHPTADLLVIKIGSLSREEQKFRCEQVNGVTTVQGSSDPLVQYDMSASRKFADVEISNEVFILGYPVSLSRPEMQQIDYDSPLVRKGIIAGKNLKNKTLILDCPAYGGNSGGLVLEVNQKDGNIYLHLIGVVVQFIPHFDLWQSLTLPGLQNSNIQNSGYSVALPVDYLYDLITKIESPAPASPTTSSSSPVSP